MFSDRSAISRMAGFALLLEISGIQVDLVAFNVISFGETYSPRCSLL